MPETASCNTTDGGTTLTGMRRLKNLNHDAKPRRQTTTRNSKQTRQPLTTATHKSDSTTTRKGRSRDLYPLENAVLTPSSTTGPSPRATYAPCSLGLGPLCALKFPTLSNPIQPTTPGSITHPAPAAHPNPSLSQRPRETSIINTLASPGGQYGHGAGAARKPRQRNTAKNYGEKTR
jgi:hypothetical protein